MLISALVAIGATTITFAEGTAAAAAIGIAAGVYEAATEDDDD